MQSGNRFSGALTLLTLAFLAGLCAQSAARADAGLVIHKPIITKDPPKSPKKVVAVGDYAAPR